MGAQAADLSQLRYIQAADVQGGNDRLEGFEVRDRLGSRLGRLAGLIVDPIAARVRYIVVGSWRGSATDCGVLPLAGARLVAHERALVMFQVIAAVSLLASPP